MKTPIVAPIASADFLLRRPGATAAPITIRIGQPYVVSAIEARCPVEVRGFEPQYPDICGNDTLQALCLAIGLVRRRLEDAMKKGCVITNSENDPAYTAADLAALFSGIGATDQPGA
jgi:hypothetical protein